MWKRGNRGFGQWLLLGGLWIGAIILGVTGFARHAAWHNLANSFWDYLYLTLQLVSLNSGAVSAPIPFDLQLARFLIPLLTAAAAIKAVLGVFNQQVRLARLRFLRGHIIICGLSRKGLLLVNAFRRQGEDVVVIEQDEENDWLESCREVGAITLNGDAADPVLLQRAGVEFARGLFAVCDDDGVNAEIVLRSHELSQQRTGEALVCLAHVYNPQLYALLRAHEAGLEQSRFRLELFNVFERGADLLLQEHPAWKEDQVKAGHTPRLLVIGLGRMGENLVLRSAGEWRSQQPDQNQRLRIIIVDREADDKVASLCIRYPQIEKDCKLTALQMDISSPEFERADFLLGKGGKPRVDAVYIEFDDDSLGLQAGLALAPSFAGTDTPIVVRMAEETGLAKLLDSRKDHLDGYKNLYAFGLLTHTCTPDLLDLTKRDVKSREE